MENENKTENGDSTVLYCEVKKSDSEESDLTIFQKETKKRRLTEKCVHLLSVITIVFLTHAVVYGQWLLPYYYCITTPLLLAIRLVMYWRSKQQYFLFDFCYYANIFVYIYVWIPDKEKLFFLVFGLANGPLIWAMFVYRNSIVFHSTDKITSSYIHYLPPLLSFGIRWYSEKTSKYWIGDFKPSTEIGVDMIIFLIVLPLICFIFHGFLYYVIVQRLLKPTDEYVTSYSYLNLREEACLTKLFLCCGKKYQCMMFYLFNWLFCLVSLTGVMLWYHFFIAHCLLLAFHGCVLIWSGANYYMHVFAVRGFADE